jgi:diguanylate cyclase (GGDEF)-like protein
VGDEVLVQVVKVLTGSMRCTDFVARYGGEEFCVLYTDVDEAQAVRLAERLRAGQSARASVLLPRVKAQA